jgi:ech hydrogenase subunit D
MSSEANIEAIDVGALVDRVRAMRQGGYRLVQISAARISEAMELTYSFDLDGALRNLRILLPFSSLVVPSISSIYGCVLLYENEMHDLFDIQVQNMAVDFHGNLYKTTVKHPFGTTKSACATSSCAAPAEGASATVPAETQTA